MTETPITKQRTLAELNEIHKRTRVNSLTEDEYIAKYRPVDGEKNDAERRAEEEAEQARWKKATPEERHEMARAFALKLVAGGDQSAADRVLIRMQQGAIESIRNERKRLRDFLESAAARFHPKQTVKARKLIAAIIADLGAI